jgi:hypothetical protein
VIYRERRDKATRCSLSGYLQRMIDWDQPLSTCPPSQVSWWGFSKRARGYERVELDDPWNGSRVESAVPCDSGFGGLRLGLFGMKAYRDEKRVVESATCCGRRLRWGDGEMAARESGR